MMSGPMINVNDIFSSTDRSPGESSEENGIGHLPNLIQEMSSKASFKPDVDQTTEHIFSLRGIDPHELLSLYRSGYFADCSIPTTKIQPSQINHGRTRYQFGNDKYDQAYQVKEGGRTRSYLTSGQPDFKLVSQAIQNGESLNNIHLSKSGCCDKCGKDLSKLPEGVYPVGIPVKLIKKGDTYIFHTMFKYCTIADAYENLLEQLHNKFGNYILEDCVQLLLFMFKLLYPTGRLARTPDSSLLQRNGGTIPDQDYSSTENYFYKTPNIICLPTKLEYGILEGGLRDTLGAT